MRAVRPPRQPWEGRERCGRAEHEPRPRARRGVGPLKSEEPAPYDCFSMIDDDDAGGGGGGGGGGGVDDDNDEDVGRSMVVDGCVGA